MYICSNDECLIYLLVCNRFIDELHNGLVQNSIHSSATSSTTSATAGAHSTGDRKRKLDPLSASNGTIDSSQAHIVRQLFQGKIRIGTYGLAPSATGAPSNGDQGISPTPGGPSVTYQTVPFKYLSLPIPSSPLFKDSEGMLECIYLDHLINYMNTGGLVIPQISIFELLKKYNGEKVSELTTDAHNGNRTRITEKTFEIQELPNYLIIHLRR